MRGKRILAASGLTQKVNRIDRTQFVFVNFQNIAIARLMQADAAFRLIRQGTLCALIKQQAVCGNTFGIDDLMFNN